MSWAAVRRVDLRPEAKCLKRRPDCCAIASCVPPNMAINATTTVADNGVSTLHHPNVPKFRGRMLASSRRCNINFFSAATLTPLLRKCSLTIWVNLPDRCCAETTGLGLRQ